MTEELKQHLQEILGLIDQDSSLSEKLREDLKDMAVEVFADPTPGNFKTLALILEKVSKAEKYLNALNTIQNL